MIKIEHDYKKSLAQRVKSVTILNCIFGCGTRTQTGNLKVMSLASCQLLYPANIVYNNSIKNATARRFLGVFVFMFKNNKTTLIFLVTKACACIAGGQCIA